MPGPPTCSASKRRPAKPCGNTTGRPRVAWTTPVAIGAAAQTQVVVSANGSIEALDPAQRQTALGLSGVEKNTSASPLAAGDLLVARAQEVASTVALRLGGRGELPPEAILWRAKEASAGFASPVLAGGCLILVNSKRHRRLRRPGERRKPLAGTPGRRAVGFADRRRRPGFLLHQKRQRLVYQVSPAAARLLASEELGTGDVVYGVAAAPGAFLLRTGHELLASRRSRRQPNLPTRCGPSLSTPVLHRRRRAAPGLPSAIFSRHTFASRRKTLVSHPETALPWEPGSGPRPAVVTSRPRSPHHGPASPREKILPHRHPESGAEPRPAHRPGHGQHVRGQAGLRVALLDPLRHHRHRAAAARRPGGRRNTAPLARQGASRRLLPTARR